MTKPAILLMALVSAASLAAAQTTVPREVTPVSLATTRDATQVGYLIVELPVVTVPNGMQLSDAYIEFFMDVSTTRDADTPTNDLVTLEVCPYRGTTGGKLDVSRLETSSMKRTVRVGAGRPARIYVTEFVAKTIADPIADRSLIIGSVSGSSTIEDARARPTTR